jgi:DNA-binding LytR/AlgR family response regulator
MKILIIEDENLAKKRLKRLLLEINSTFNIVNTLESVEDSIEFLNKNKVDLIFSDIQLADGLSFEIFEQVEVNCPIIFTTAFNQYAIEAFNTNGIDYLLKPIEEDRLQQALNKYKSLNLQIDIKQLMTSISHSSKSFKKRFMIKVGDKIKSIPTNEINAFYSLQKGTYLLTNNGRNYVVDYTLGQVSDLLNPTQFFKINRKCIVSINAVNDIIAHTNSRLKLNVEHLTNQNTGFEDVIVAREKVSDFKKWLDA